MFLLFTRAFPLDLPDKGFLKALRPTVLYEPISSIHFQALIVKHILAFEPSLWRRQLAMTSFGLIAFGYRERQRARILRLAYWLGESAIRTRGIKSHVRRTQGHHDPCQLVLSCPKHHSCLLRANMTCSAKGSFWGDSSRKILLHVW